MIRCGAVQYACRMYRRHMRCRYHCQVPRSSQINAKLDAGDPSYSYSWCACISASQLAAASTRSFNIATDSVCLTLVSSF